MTSYSGKTKITAKADCITGNPLLLEERGTGTSSTQALLWGDRGWAGDRFNLVTWLERPMANTKHNVRAAERKTMGLRGERSPEPPRAAALWGLASLHSCLPTFLSSTYSQKSSRCLVRKKRLSLENIIKQRDMKNRLEKKIIKRKKEWRR